jgi:hypothetical protein
MDPWPSEPARTHCTRLAPRARRWEAYGGLLVGCVLPRLLGSRVQRFESFFAPGGRIRARAGNLDAYAPLSMVIRETRHE